METNKYFYWCYNCQKHFQTNKEAEICTYCSGSAFESVEQQNDNPSSFQIYQIPTATQPLSNNNNNFQNQANQNSFGYMRTNIQLGPGGINYQSFNFPIGGFNPQFLSSFASSLLSPNGGIMNLINSLIGQSNLVSATQGQINQLTKINIVNNCSICQQDDINITNQQQKKGVKLKCGHQFHNHCIKPWFQRTNTCPYCRVRL